MVERTKQQPQEQVVFFTKERILRWMRLYNSKQDLHPELTRYERSRTTRYTSIRSVARRLAGIFNWRKSQASSSCY